MSAPTVVGAAIAAVAVLFRPRTLGMGAKVVVPAKAQKYLALFQEIGNRVQIPLPVLLAWVKRESDFDARRYNPEVGAMSRWACAIANDAAKWSRNPDYRQAVDYCARMQAGTSPESLKYDWAFGSRGLMQVSRITASGSGGYPYDAWNDGLYDPETNVKVGCKIIHALRSKLFPGQVELTADQWSKVRAAYVGGAGIFDKNPSKAESIARDYLATLSDMTQVAA